MLMSTNELIFRLLFLAHVYCSMKAGSSFDPDQLWPHNFHHYQIFHIFIIVVIGHRTSIVDYVDSNWICDTETLPSLLQLR